MRRKFGVEPVSLVGFDGPREVAIPKVLSGFKQRLVHRPERGLDRLAGDSPVTIGVAFLHLRMW